MGRPTTPKSGGPILGPAPFSKLWQVWQTLAICAPFVASALASSVGSGGASGWAGPVAASVAGPEVGKAKPGTLGICGDRRRLLKAVSSMTNNTAPSAVTATRFTFTWSMEKGAFVGWREAGRDVRYVVLISRFARALATRISPPLPNLA